MMGVHKLVGGVVCLSLCIAVPARAADDVIVFWNAETARAAAPAPPARPTGRPGPSSVLDLAMVHAAMHDAIQAIQGRFHTYSGALSSAEGSEVAAAAAAAHAILVNRFPLQKPALDATLATYLGACDEACEAGVAVGESAANAIIAMRTGDGAHPSPAATPFFGGVNPGDWRPTSFVAGVAQPMTISWMGDVRPFTLTSSGQFEVRSEPRLTSQEYTRDYNEVKNSGRATGSTRTPAQNATALFFREGAAGYWARTLAVLAPQHLPDLGDRARLYALVHLAIADSVITSWHSKKLHNFWRPETAIHLGGEFDTNPDTIGEPGWVPHTPSPNYPDYTSGANNINGAVTGILRLVFGTNHMEFSLLGTGNVSRSYTRFSDVAADVVDARVLEGIHFRFADTAGRTQGRDVAKWAFKHTLRPVGAEDAVADEEDEDDEE